MFAVLPYRLDTPFALIDYAFEPLWRRVPFSPATTPIFFSSFTDEMGLRERVENTVAYLMTYWTMPGR